MIFDEITPATIVNAHRPWPRAIVDDNGWRFATSQMAEGRWSLLGLWGDVQAVHMAIRSDATNVTGIVSLACPDGDFPSVAQRHAPALRLERTVQDLFGFTAEGRSDTRPWLDHGRWKLRHPLGGKTPPDGESRPYAFLPAEGEGLHQVAVGPVHAGIIEPGFFQFTANGEAVVRLEERFGYAHKGVEGLMAGRDLAHAARLAARMSGDSTVGYAYAFCLAAEAALGIEVPSRAVWLRALMAELERIANHLGDFGAICNDASFAIMHAQCGVLRERVLRAADACFGHRLMRDRIVVGGVAADLAREGAAQIEELLIEIGRRLPALAELYDKTASLQDRTVGTGILQPSLARQYACGGYVGRASGRSFDARKALAYAPYDRLTFDVPVLKEGDVNARVWIRIREIEQSLTLIRQIIDRLPQGALRTPIAAGDGGREGVALVEGFRGDILAWLRIAADGSVERSHLRDPSWFQWPLLEAAIEGNIIADFPLCNKSFNCSYSGHDL